MSNDQRKPYAPRPTIILPSTPKVGDRWGAMEVMSRRKGKVLVEDGGVEEEVEQWELTLRCACGCVMEVPEAGARAIVSCGSPGCRWGVLMEGKQRRKAGGKVELLVGLDGGEGMDGGLGDGVRIAAGEQANGEYKGKAIQAHRIAGLTSAVRKATTNLSVSMPVDLNEEVYRTAKGLGIGVSELVRMAVRKWLDSTTKKGSEQ